MTTEQQAKYDELIGLGLTPEVATAEAMKIQGASAPASGLDAMEAKGVKNAIIIATLKAAGVEVGELPVVIDIKPTKTAGKFTVYVIASVDLGVSEDNTKSFDRMNPFELAGQAMGGNNLQRGKMTMTQDVIDANGIRKGAPLTININDVDVESRLEVYEKHAPFYAGQQPVGFTNDKNVFVESKRGGKSFYRDTKITPAHSLSHQLLGTSVASVTE